MYIYGLISFNGIYSALHEKRFHNNENEIFLNVDFHHLNCHVSNLNCSLLTYRMSELEA